MKDLNIYELKVLQQSLEYSKYYIKNSELSYEWMKKVNDYINTQICIVNENIEYILYYNQN